MRKLILGATAIATLAVPAITPALASAAAPADKTVTVVTHSAQHPDTTSVSGDATIMSPGGPVWAYDNLSLRYVVTPLGGDQWRVAIESQGSFAGFASPTTGNADINNGSTKGNITYTVTSSSAPDKALGPAQEPNGSSIRLAIAQMFHLNPASFNLPDSPLSGGDQYTFTYNQVDGSLYQQTA
jgi:hypothetical protein